MQKFHYYIHIGSDSVKDRTTDELLEALGSSVQRLRLAKSLMQRDLAMRAGVSVGALSNLERGLPVTLPVFVRIIRALDRTPWLDALAPQVQVDPLDALKLKRPRQRASSPTRLNSKRLKAAAANEAGHGE